MKILELSKKILFIDLEKETFEVKTFSNLHKFIGGVGLSVGLYQMYKEFDPLIFTIGPLSGFFPFISKTAILFKQQDFIEDIYLGGSLSDRIRFMGLDGIAFLKRANRKLLIDINTSTVSFHSEDPAKNEFGLPGKRSVITKGILDKYFGTPNNLLKTCMHDRNLDSLILTGQETYEIKDFDNYIKLYTKLLAQKDDVLVEMGNLPSCGNCPMGCSSSHEGEIGGNVLLHSLVGCKFSENIYSNYETIFSCLNSLGYIYTHEDLENLPRLIEKTLHEIHNS